MPSTMVDLLRAGMEESDVAVRFLDSDSVISETTWGVIWERSLRRAAALQERGVRPGDRVGVLGFTSQELVETVIGIVCAGAAVTMLPLPMRLASVEAFLEATRARLAAADPALLVLDPFFVEQYEPGPADPATVATADLDAPVPAAVAQVEAEDLCVLQFTSGSTADPRAVRLHHGALAANLHAIRAGVDLGAGDVIVSWLPLYHDMGLIGGVFAAAVCGTEAVYSTPQAFMGRPAMWMEAVSRYGATVVVAPNFAYALATRALRRAEDLDLSTVRAALCGAEPVDAANMAKFYAEGERFGLDPDAALAVYGLAESTLAVTFPTVGTGLSVDTVNRVVLEKERRAVRCDDTDNAKKVVGLGRPLAGVAIRVVTDDGDACAEREVGEVLVAGQSLMQGYDRHPRETERVLRHGWLHTGDLGYVADGELYLCGRKKDVIIVGGRNIFPEDIEHAAHLVEGVRAGNAIAFGVEGDRGKEAIVLVAETKVGPDAAADIAHAIVESVRRQVGLPPRQVVLLAPGELPKTSSGKLQRSLCRARYLKGELQPVASSRN